MGRKINIKKRETHEKTLEIERGDEGEVRAVGRIVYTDNQEGWNTRCPSIGSAYPDDAALRLKKISMEGMEGDMVRVTLYYELPRETSFEFGGGEEVEYSMDYSCSEQPLLTHPNFQDIDGEEKDALMRKISVPAVSSSARRMKNFWTTGTSSNCKVFLTSSNYLTIK